MTLHESQKIQRRTLTADLAAGGNVCPVCYRETPEEFVPMLVLEEGLQKLIVANAPGTEHLSGPILPAATKSIQVLRPTIACSAGSCGCADPGGGASGARPG